MTCPSRIIALDIGQARIGLAVADFNAKMAFGRGYITRTKLKDDLKELKRFYLNENAKLIVVGLPLRTDGKNSKQTQRVRAFARILENEGYDTVFEDERFSSKIAEKSLLLSGLSKKKRREKGLIDEEAAKLILENYLENTTEGENGQR